MYSNFVRINSQYSDKSKDNSEKYLTNSRGGGIMENKDTYQGIYPRG